MNCRTSDAPPIKYPKRAISKPERAERVKSEWQEKYLGATDGAAEEVFELFARRVLHENVDHANQVVLAPIVRRRIVPDQTPIMCLELRASHPV